MKTYLGIDLHKYSSRWVLINEEKEIIKELEVPCKTEKFLKAIELIGTPPVATAMEPFGNWRQYSSLLDEHGYNVKISNPCKNELIAKSKQKNDHNDAYTLARQLRMGEFPESYKCSNEIFALRNLARDRNFYIRAQTATKVRIQCVALQSGLNEELGGNVLKAPARAALKEGDNEQIRLLLQHLTNIEVTVEEAEERIKVATKNNPVIKLLQTMPGIGVHTSACIYAEVADFSRFKNADQLAAYAGLVPSERSSGQMTVFGHITKQGPKLLRYPMIEAAFRIRNTPDSKTLFEFYSKLRPKKGAMKARTALARKMLTIMWYMVKNNKPYREPDLTSKSVDTSSYSVTYDIQQPTLF